MGQKKIARQLEMVITTICRDIRKHGTAGSEKLARLAQLTNAYRRLLANDEVSAYENLMMNGRKGAYEELLQSDEE